MVSALAPLSCGCRRIIQVDAAHWWWLRRDPHMIVKRFRCIAIHKALYKCFIHSFIHSYRRSEQLFVSFGNHVKGRPVTKKTISRWLVDAITLAYSSLGLQCPIGVRAHSTIGIASSWAWSSGVSISEICEAAGWSSPSTFARFYNLAVPALQARVLSA